MTALLPQKVPIPQGMQDNLTGLHAEAYDLPSGAAIIVTREDVSDARQQNRNWRWHIQIGHADRMPQPDEIIAARKLCPDVHMAMPFPRSGFDRVDEFGTTVHLWEVQDPNLTEQWEAESVAHGEQ